MNLHNREISFALEHGMFIDAKEATTVVDAALERLAKSSKRLILDGFPADYRQVQWLIDSGRIEDLEGAIVLRVPRGELWRRLVARKRVDDTRAAIERRQDLYDRNITGMIHTLTMNGVEVREVDGGNEPKDVLERIDGVLADWGMVPKKQFEDISEQVRPVLAEYPQH